MAIIGNIPYFQTNPNRGYPQIAILMGNIVIIHWNLRYTIFRQTHNWLWVKQCHVYHPWLGMVNIAPIYGDLGDGLPQNHPKLVVIGKPMVWGTHILENSSYTDIVFLNVEDRLTEIWWSGWVFENCSIYMFLVFLGIHVICICMCIYMHYSLWNIIIAYGRSGFVGIV